MRELTFNELDSVSGGDRNTTVGISKFLGKIGGGLIGAEFGNPASVLVGSSIGEAAAESAAGWAWDTLHGWGLVHD